ncbi:MAG: LexA family protein [Candidatus Thorarchaeota archaeon]|jgi:SOS-response transcriptional repressor LexA
MRTPDEYNETREKVYRAIENFWDDNGYSPSIRDLSNAVRTHFGAKTSTSVINWHLRILEKNGRILQDRGVARSIRLVKEN